MKNETKTMTVAELRDVTERILTLHQKMGYLTPLAAVDRHERRRKVKVKDLPLLQTHLRLALENREAVPPMIDLAALDRNVGLAMALSDLWGALDAIHSDVSDTFLRVGELATTGVAEVNRHLTLAVPSQRSRRGRPRAQAPVAASNPNPVPVQAVESSELNVAMPMVTKQAA
jgi:hypothetical protein